MGINKRYIRLSLRLTTAGFLFYSVKKQLDVVILHCNKKSVSTKESTMSKFKVSFNGSTLCVFSVIEESCYTHLANIDTLTNRIYTTIGGYELLGDNLFKKNHKPAFFDKQDNSNLYSESEDSYKSEQFRKFNVAVQFDPKELEAVIKMCSRAFNF